MTRSYQKYIDLIVTLHRTPTWTQAELRAHLGWGPHAWISPVVSALHEAKILHVVEWRRDKQGGFRIPVYAYGPGTDAPRPLAQRYRR